MISCFLLFDLLYNNKKYWTSSININKNIIFILMDPFFHLFTNLMMDPVFKILDFTILRWDGKDLEIKFKSID